MAASFLPQCDEAVIGGLQAAWVILANKKEAGLCKSLKAACRICNPPFSDSNEADGCLICPSLADGRPPGNGNAHFLHPIPRILHSNNPSPMRLNSFKHFISD